MTHRLPALLISAAALAMPMLMLGGCATHDSRITTLAAPMQLTDLGLDVENPFGGVRVEVDQDFDHICMTESLLTPAFATDELREAFQGRVTLSTERVEAAPGMETLRVRVVALEPMQTEEGVNLTIRLPRCDGIRVRNTAGSAELVGVTGAIHVETIDGDIEVRCDEPVRAPVALIADSGNVYLQSPGGDEGRVELMFNNGDATFESMTIDTVPARGAGVVDVAEYRRLEEAGHPSAGAIVHAHTHAEVMSAPVDRRGWGWGAAGILALLGLALLWRGRTESEDEVDPALESTFDAPTFDEADATWVDGTLPG